MSEKLGHVLIYINGVVINGSHTTTCLCAWLTMNTCKMHAWNGLDAWTWELDKRLLLVFRTWILQWQLSYMWPCFGNGLVFSWCTFNAFDIIFQKTPTLIAHTTPTSLPTTLRAVSKVTILTDSPLPIIPPQSSSCQVLHPLRKNIT